MRCSESLIFCFWKNTGSVLSLCAGINGKKWQNLLPWPECSAVSRCCWWTIIPRMILLFSLPIPSIWEEAFCLISPFPAFPALFSLEGQGRMWDVTGARENRRDLLVLSKEMLGIPNQDCSHMERSMAGEQRRNFWRTSPVQVGGDPREAALKSGISFNNSYSS